MLVAYIVGVDGAAPTVTALREFLGKHLPPYMIPAVFASLASMPLTTSGKVDRKALPAPDESRLGPDTTYAPPRNAVEGALVDVWESVLGVRPIGIHDNFFNLGGDSILTIQVIARARARNLHLTPKVFFHAQTIEEMAAAITEGPVAADQGIVTGAVPLTPIQHWFFAAHGSAPHHWNQSVLLEVTRQVHPDAWHAALRELLRHHDALRLRFEQTDTGWEQVLGDASDDDLPFEYFDISASPAADRVEIIERETAKCQARLNISTGPLIRMQYFDGGAELPGRVCLVIHHLAVDGVSWRILLEDLNMLVEAHARSTTPQLPPKTTSWKEWAERLGEYANSNMLRPQVQHWRKLNRARWKLSDLPVESTAGSNDEQSGRRITQELSQEITDALLHQVPSRLQVHIEDVLLTALARACERWTGNRSLFVHLEGHGREDVIEGLDLSRTVGWFTTMYPFVLDLGTAKTLEDQVAGISRRRADLPSRGIGYGLLRYLHRDPHVRTALESMPTPGISFNYLGQFHQAEGEDRLFRLAQESTGSDSSPSSPRTHLVDVVLRVVENRLRIEWTYSANRHGRPVMEEVVRWYVEELRRFVDLLPSARETSPAAHPHVDGGVSADELERVFAELQGTIQR
jgi:non-ribosomal peptide synthase protein (TIGR01720 family)